MKKSLLLIFLPLVLSVILSLSLHTPAALYANLNQPPFAPPSWLFPAIWTILYILMGISFYLIYTSKSPHRTEGLLIFVIQLVLNLSWPIIFFNAQNTLLALIFIFLLIFSVYHMIKIFNSIKPIAAKLLIPYFVWLIFAAYLNFVILILNVYIVK